MINYIFASSKPWHKENANYLSSEVLKKSVWVSSTEELFNALEKIAPKYIFFLHWNWIVSSEIFTRYECVCFHMTDVPYGRGGSPLQNLILLKHKRTKLTALKMVKELDAGPVYLKKDLDLSGSAEEIYNRTAILSFEIIEWMVKNEPIPIPQSGNNVIFKRREPNQSELSKELDSLDDLYDFIRMLDAPTYPHAFIKYGDLNIEFKDAKLLDDELYATVKIKFERKN